MQKNRFKYVVIILLALAALTSGIGAYFYFEGTSTTRLAKINGTVFPESRVISPFKLVTGATAFSNKNLQGRWSLVFFGFTNCPVVCPTTMALLNQAYAKLQAENYQPLPQVVFISVDPARDSPKQVKQYAAGFNTHFLGVTGDEKQIAQLAREVGAVYMKVELAPMKTGEKQAYTIDHSTAVMLIDPAGRLRAILSSPENGDKLAQDYQEVTKAYAVTPLSAL